MATAKTLTLFLLSLSFFFNFSHQATTISVSSKILTKSSHTIKIEWSNILDPSPLDWLGIYSPPSSSDDEFIGYIFLNTSIGYQSGSGSIWLPLTNIRSNYQFRIFRWTEDEIDPRRQDRDQNPLPQTKHKLADSVKVGFGEERLGPDQVHLAFTNYVDEIRVMFVMGDGSPGWVRYGKDIKKLNVQVETKISRYEKDDMCDFPANSSFGWRDPGWVHDGVMKELESGKKYFYQVGSDLRGWSPIYNFISRDNNANETYAILFGDMGTDVPYTTFYRAQQESTSTVKWILRDIENLGNKPVFVSHIGDISYARGCSWLWDEFFTQIEPIASKVPYHVCIGNHEYDWPSQPWKPSWARYVYNKDGGGECGVPYSIKFRMPGNSSFPTGTSAPDTRNLYYSFDAGVVHFLYVSTETNFLKGSDQYDFIKTDLRKVNRRKTPFVVVQGHRPMYTTSSGDKDIPLRKKLLEHLEPILVENNVTLALWGHVHRYERFCPMNNFTCTVLSSNFTGVGGSPVHVVIGMGGQDWQKSWEPRDNHRDLPIYPQPSRSMYRGGEFGYTRLFATREKLVLSYVGNHDGEVHDFVEILSGLSDNIMVDKHSHFDYLSNINVKISKYVMGSCILVLEVFLGYLFVIRCGKGCVQRDTWLPIMSEDV